MITEETSLQEALLHNGIIIERARRDRRSLSNVERYIILGARLNRPLRDFIVIADGTDRYYSHRNENYEL